ncbi:MAG TPA: type II secretion system protein G [Methylophilaceae bacterium]|nr:type II secretion system protein G [Methylophilaceae bacterium]
MLSGSPNKKQGFTLVELLVVLSILALLLTLAVPRYFKSIERAKEATLKHDLNSMRDGIDKYYADHGKYPESLEELSKQKYINKLPIDPITESTSTWIIIPPEPPLEGEVYDVQSGATGTAQDGTKFSTW